MTSEEVRFRYNYICYQSQEVARRLWREADRSSASRWNDYQLFRPQWKRWAEWEKRFDPVPCAVKRSTDAWSLKGCEGC